MSKVEKIILLPILICCIGMYAGMSLNFIYLKELKGSVICALLCFLTVYIVFVYPRNLPYLGLDETSFVVYERKKSKSIPFYSVSLIQVCYRYKMYWIVFFGNKNEELFSVPYQKVLLMDLISISDRFGWKVVR